MKELFGEIARHDVDNLKMTRQHNSKTGAPHYLRGSKIGSKMTPRYRPLPKSIWRTVNSWSFETWLTILNHTNISSPQEKMNGEQKGKPWTALLLESDFCQNCEKPFAWDANPKVVSIECGHISCRSCTRSRALQSGRLFCHECGKTEKQKVKSKV